MKKAVVLCAGKGTRLGPLTGAAPKVMLPVKGKPLLESHLWWLKQHGIREVYINLHHLPGAITRHCGDGTRFGLNIVYSLEKKLRGTAGALSGFREHLDETFLVHYGDVYSELDITSMLGFHCKSGAVGTLAVHPTDRPEDSDVVTVGPHSRISAVHHKPGNDRYGLIGNAGCYILEPAVLDYIPHEDREIDFVQDVFPRMLACGEALYAYSVTEFLQDMGTAARYENLRQRLEEA